MIMTTGKRRPARINLILVISVASCLSYNVYKYLLTGISLDHNFRFCICGDCGYIRKQTRRICEEMKIRFAKLEFFVSPFLMPAHYLE